MTIISGDTKIGLSLPSALEGLSAEQLALLDSGPGRLRNRAVLASYEELEYRRAISGINDWPPLNNFFLFFMPGGEHNPQSSMKRSMPCYQRFEILYPEVTKKALETVAQYGNQAMVLPNETLEEAYRIMSALVDQDDPYVKVDGEVDPFFLTR